MNDLEVRQLRYFVAAAEEFHLMLGSVSTTPPRRERGRTLIDHAPDQLVSRVINSLTLITGAVFGGCDFNM
jgi:hypothetical protein